LADKTTIIMPANRYTGRVITPAQIRAARALLGWKQTDLAKAAGVSEISVKNIERSATDPRASTLLRIQRALEQAGVEIIQDGSPSLDGGGGVRLKSTGGGPTG
jgi:transcriptional regulator with XRE-family HTH domain